jgi:hypothetical protein
MILTSIIPSNILSALRTYIRNYVDSLNNPQKAYLSFYDYSSESVTNLNADEWTELIMVATEGFSFDGLSFADNGIITNVGGEKILKAEAIISISGSNGREIDLAFFKNGSIIPDSEQSVVLDSGGKHAALPIQCVLQFETADTIQIFVKQKTHTDPITLFNANVILTEL